MPATHILVTAQQRIEKAQLRTLFKKYGIQLVLHWNKRSKCYELRARKAHYNDKYLATLDAFLALSHEARKARLQSLAFEIERVHIHDTQQRPLSAR